LGKYQQEKKIVRSYFDSMEKAAPEEAEKVLDQYVSSNYDWKGSYPFRQQYGRLDVAEKFWTPLKLALGNMQRRQDVFIAGNNELDESEVWVMSMGNFMGNFQKDWLGIRRTNKLINLRYAEFACVQDGKISKTGLFVDLIGFMIHAGVNPLPATEASCYVYPGPREHNGLLFDDADDVESAITSKLILDMCREVVPYDEDGDQLPKKDITKCYWAEDMLWYGSAGAVYTIPGFEKEQQKFRSTLIGRKFVNHTSRFSEGQFGCFFGWPNIINTPVGGYLGLPGGQVAAEMQVVDVYYRKENKLAENWVIIDLPYWLKQQGLDLFDKSKFILQGGLKDE
jgi:hypothetical protein